MLTQDASQRVLQQNGSISQIIEQHSAIAEPPRLWTINGDVSSNTEELVGFQSGQFPPDPVVPPGAGLLKQVSKTAVGFVPPPIDPY